VYRAHPWDSTARGGQVLCWRSPAVSWPMVVWGIRVQEILGTSFLFKDVSSFSNEMKSYHLVSVHT